MRYFPVFRLFSLPIVLLMLFGGISAQPQIQLTPFATGLNEPVDIVNAGDSRLFIVEQPGIIRVVDSTGNIFPNPYLNITNKVLNTFSEQGLLGLAFDPDYFNNRRFYVNYIDNNGNSVISRFLVANDPNTADPGSEQILMTISQPFVNHNGGDLAFGPDGYLYIGLGDGGSANDPGNRSQNPQLLLGKMLRIDVSGNTYSIPADNPFVNDPNVLDEIWAIGLRNPWRYSFDRLTGDLWIGDVGQDDWEEIDFQPGNSMGGENYGWRCYEGNNAFNTGGCLGMSSYTFPVFEYFNQFDCSVTGGYVYRGTDHPGMYGHYIFADFCSGRIWSLYDDNGSWEDIDHGIFVSFNFSSFGENVDGELFLAGLDDGIIYRVSDMCSGMPVPIIVLNGNVLSASGGPGYQWFLEGNLIPGATSIDYTPATNGNYTVAVTYPNGCTVVSDTFVYNLSSIEESDFGESLKIYPNPTSGQLFLEMKTGKPEFLDVQLYDLAGKLLSEQHLQLSNHPAKQAILLPELNPGLYILHVQGEDRSKTETLFIQ